MKCFVYKGSLKQDHYLFLAEKVEDQDTRELPAALLTMLGELSYVLEFDLTEQRELPQAEATQVLSDIESQGFYLQMPKKDMLAEENQWFN